MPWVHVKGTMHRYYSTDDSAIEAGFTHDDKGRVLVPSTQCVERMEKRGQPHFATNIVPGERTFTHATQPHQKPLRVSGNDREARQQIQDHVDKNLWLPKGLKAVVHNTG